MSQYPYHPRQDDGYNNPFGEDNLSPPFLRPSPVSPINPRDSAGHFAHNTKPLPNPFSEARSHGGYESLSADRPSLPEDLRLNTGVKRIRTGEAMAKWKTTIHWYVPTAMVVVFLLGCGGAIAHHMFYTQLHGKPAEDQIWKNRYGTAIAFFTKACLVGSVVLAYRQRIWQTVRRKAITLRGLDSLFSIIEDPAWFVLSGEMYRKAKVATMLALMAWLIPLAAVVAPGSLTTALILNVHNTTCNVRTLNFTAEGPSDWRALERPGFNLAFWDQYPAAPANSTFDFYNQPSFQTERVATLYAYARRGKVPDETESPCLGYNCTYSLSFRAPSYKCAEAPMADSPFNISHFAPNSPPTPEPKPVNVSLEDIGEPVWGNYLYSFHADDSSLYMKQPQENVTGYQDRGRFTYEPPLWFGIAINTTKQSTFDPRWKFELVPTAYKCIHQMADYVVTANWINDAINRTYIIGNETELLPAGQIREPVQRRIPESRDDRDPIHFEYRQFVAAHALSQKLQENFLAKTLRLESWSRQVVSTSKIGNTRLVDNSSQPVENFIQEFEKFYHGYVLSLFQEPDLVVMNSNKPDNERKILVPCTQTRYQNQFQYQARSLWIGYSLAIAAALVAIIFGCSAILYNGMTSDTSFSKIMVTTRNATLDGLVKSYPGASLGGDPVPAPLETTPLRFGIIDNWVTKQEDAYRRAEASKGNNGGYMGVVELDQWPRHTAFGLEDEVLPIGQGDVENSSSAIAGLEGMRGDDGQNIELRRRHHVPGSGMGVLYGA